MRPVPHTGRPDMPVQSSGYASCSLHSIPTPRHFIHVGSVTYGSNSCFPQIPFAPYGITSSQIGHRLGNTRSIIARFHLFCICIYSPLYCFSCYIMCFAHSMHSEIIPLLIYASSTSRSANVVYRFCSSILSIIVLTRPILPTITTPFLALVTAV